MTWLGRAALILCCVSVVRCGGGGKGDPNSPDPGNSGQRITGNERLGWTQRASNSNDVNRLRYVAYVDGSRVELTGVQCGGGSSAAFECSSRMPSMTPGSHTLELASYFIEAGTVVEGPRSAPIQVNLVAATVGTDPAPGAAASEQTTLDGQQLRLDVIATGLEQVTSLAFSDDGVIFVGERAGRIRVVPATALARGASAAAAALSGADQNALHDLVVNAESAGGLLDLALDPAFVRTRFVYALYTVNAPRNGAQFRISRFREVGGRLGERVILFDGLKVSPGRPAGAIGFGPDGKLYAAFDDGGDPMDSGRASSYSGKVLRLNADGTTPQDQPGGTPVFASDYRSPRGFDWNPSSGALWVADASPPDIETLRLAEAGQRHPRVPARVALRLPQGTAAAAIAFYRGTLMPALDGDLFAASSRGHVLRVRLDRREPVRIVGSERLFADVTGPLSALATSPDGALYLGSDRAVLRIGPR